MGKAFNLRQNSGPNIDRDLSFALRQTVW